MTDESLCICGMLVPEQLQKAVIDGTFTGNIVPVPMFVLEQYPDIIKPPDIGLPWLRNEDCPYHRDKPLRWSRERGIYIKEE